MAVKRKFIDNIECMDAITDRLEVLEERAMRLYKADQMLKYCALKDVINEVKYIRQHIVAKVPEVNVWHTVSIDGLPTKRYDSVYDMPVEYLVTIKGAKEPTVLSCDEFGRWWDEYDNSYNVIAWAEMPPAYKGV